MFLPVSNSELQPACVFGRIEKLVRRVPQLVHTILSVHRQGLQHGPIARLPSKTLCGQDSIVDHLRRSPAQEVLLSHYPLESGELRFRLVVAANDRDCARREHGSWLLAGAELLDKFFLLVGELAELVLLDRRHLVHTMSGSGSWHAHLNLTWPRSSHAQKHACKP